MLEYFISCINVVNHTKNIFCNIFSIQKQVDINGHGQLRASHSWVQTVFYMAIKLLIDKYSDINSSTYIKWLFDV